MFSLKNIFVGMLFLGFSFTVEVQAKSARVCNGSPVSVDVSIGYVDSIGFKTEGWWNLDSGECILRTDVNSSKFYYYAESYSELAKWLNDGDPIIWDSIFSNYCAPSKVYKIRDQKNCQKPRAFKTVYLHNESNEIFLFEENHKGLTLEQARESHRRLEGRMRYEMILHDIPGRESAFQLGIDLKANKMGVEIAGIYQGMPSESEGLVKGDIITKLDDQKVRNKEHLISILDDLSLFRETPLNLTILRNGEYFEGFISPLFFPFNHSTYDPKEKVGTFLWSIGDGSAFGFINELICGTTHTLAESIRAADEFHDFNGKANSKRISNCSNVLNAKLARRTILYDEAATAGLWASILVPGIPLAKASRLGKMIPLAAKSRKVAGKSIKKSFGS